MFCPNCGTSNDDSAARCKQCGFELQQARPAAPRFKGTMLLGQSPFAGQPAGAQPAGAQPGAGQAGAAPAGSGGQPPGPAQPSGAAARSALKGTMVGVAPPAVGSAAPPVSPGPNPAGAAPAAAGARPQGGFKGTMLGIAPPSLGSPAASTPAHPAAPGAGQPAAGQPPAGQASSPTGQSQGNPMPSKLKGTMIGVAPPSIGSAPAAPPADQPAGDAAMAATMAIPSQAPQVPNPAAAPAPPGLAKTEVIPAAKPSDSVNPLGGTVLGNPAPDFSGALAPGATQPLAAQPAAGQPAGADPALDRTALGQPPAPQGMPGSAGAGAKGSSSAALAATTPSDGGLQPGDQRAAGAPAAQPAPAGDQQLAVAASGRGPVGKVRNPVAILLLSMLCFVYGLVAFVQMVRELRAFRQKDDLSLLLFFIPIIGLIELLKLPEKVTDAQRMAGIRNPQVAHPVLYLFFFPYFFAADLNEVWEAARRS